MHLDHKIPWNTVSSHFTLVKSNPRYTPRYTDLFPRNLASQANDLNHFARVLINTIREFSTTERAKYPVDMHATPLPEPGKLFSDELLAYPESKYGLGKYMIWSVHHNPLSAEYQRINYWVSRAEANDHPLWWWGYRNMDGDLAGAVKMLIVIAASVSEDGPAEDTRKLDHEAMSALIRLSQHPKIPLHHLRTLSWGYSFGVDRLAQTALKAYLLINIMDAVLARQRYTEATGIKDGKEVSLLQMSSFVRLTREILPNCDHGAQNIPHRAFWHAHGVNEATLFHEHDLTPVSMLVQDQGVTDPLAQGVTAEVRRGLKEYLKICFGLMYRYDLLQRVWYGEKRADQWWKAEIVGAIMDLWRVKAYWDICDDHYEFA